MVRVPACQAGCTSSILVVSAIFTNYLHGSERYNQNSISLSKLPTRQWALMYANFIKFSKLPTRQWTNEKYNSFLNYLHGSKWIHIYRDYFLNYLYGSRLQLKFRYCWPLTQTVWSKPLIYRSSKFMSLYEEMKIFTSTLTLHFNKWYLY